VTAEAGGDCIAKPASTPNAPPTPTASRTKMILPHDTDPTPVGELLAAWVGAKLAEVDDLVDEARSRVDAIPSQRQLWLLLGETLVRLHCLELEVADLKRGRR
jgi:hypothetical protein